MTNKTRDQIEALQRSGFGTLTGIVQVAIDRMYQQEIGSRPQEKTMNSKNVDKNSVKKIAHELFTNEDRRGQQVSYYVDPSSGEVEAFLTGEIPFEGWEYLFSAHDAYIDWGQDLCESDEEIEEAFAHWAAECLNDFVSKLEDAWDEAL